MDFCFATPTPSSVPAISSPLAAPIHIVPPDAVYRVEVLDGDGRPHIRPVASLDFFASVLTSFGGTFVCTGEVVDSTLHFHISPGPSLVPLSSSIWR